MKQVHWTKDTMEFFIEKGMLTEEQVYILESRVKGATVVEQSMHLHKSESSVHRQIKRIRDCYDIVQKQYPDKLPIRRYSAKEVYMDTH